MVGSQLQEKADVITLHALLGTAKAVEDEGEGRGVTSSDTHVM